MTDLHHSEAVFDLMAEIQRMEDVVLYYQNRILRKQIAIAELLSQHPEKAQTTEESSALSTEPALEVTLSDAVRATVNGTPMGLPEIRKVIEGQFPSMKIKSLGSILTQLRLHGELTATGRPHLFKYTKRVKALLASILFLVTLNASALQSPKDAGLQQNAVMVRSASVTLAWDAPVTMTPTGYTLVYAAGSINSSGLQAMVSLQVNVTYTFYVLAHYPAGDARSNTLTVTVSRKGRVTATVT